jgi:hypothetical protein
VSKVSIMLENPGDGAEMRGRELLSDVRVVRLHQLTSSQAWLKIIDATQEYPDGGIEITLDTAEIGQPILDQREQAKKALEAYGHMLNAHERLGFEKMTTEDPTAITGTVEEISARLQTMFEAPVPANARIRERSNMAEYAAMKDWNDRPIFWKEYVELTDEELKKEAEDA